MGLKTSLPTTDRVQGKAANPKGHLVLMADGASRGNPGPAGAAAVLLDQAGNQVAAICRYLGRTTNNVAEYQGLIMGLERAAELGARSLSIRLDSELVVRQMNGQYRVRKNHLKSLYDRARALLQSFSLVDIIHIPRSENRLADSLANQAIDQGAEGQ